MKTGYKLLEVIEMPKDTKVHMINGKDYKINEQGELVTEHGDKLPISKNNIDNCEFTIIEDLKNYNFRIYKDNYMFPISTSYGNNIEVVAEEIVEIC